MTILLILFRYNLQQREVERLSIQLDEDAGPSNRDMELEISMEDSVDHPASSSDEFTANSAQGVYVFF